MIDKKQKREYCNISIQKSMARHDNQSQNTDISFDAKESLDTAQRRHRTRYMPIIL